MRTWKLKTLKLKLVLEILIFISHLLRMRTNLFCLYFMDMDIIKSLQRLSRQILMLFARLTILVLMGWDLGILVKKVTFFGLMPCVKFSKL
ncbi:hypothetical protein BMF38_03320 [Comamonas kerstersii]|nr:hypothetical protein BMF38_03320 [Comamonas kerstersii]